MVMLGCFEPRFTHNLDKNLYTTRIKAIAHRVRNFRRLKNKYDLTLCQSRLHTASETFVRHKKKLDQVRFSAFSHP